MELMKKENTSLVVFKKRPVALLIAALMISSSTLYSVHRTLGAVCQEISDGFYTGVVDSGWGTTRRSINSQLTKRSEAAAGLVTVLNQFDELSDISDALRTAQRNLRDNSTGIQQSYKLNKQLSEAFTVALQALNELNLNERDQRMIDEFKTSFNGAQSVIDSSGYNESVREFERSTLNVFPTNILKGIVGGKLPQLFE